MVACFKPFLRSLLNAHLSPGTLRRHRDNLWLLGGEIISRLQIDRGLRRQPIELVVRNLIGDDGGPLLSIASRRPSKMPSTRPAANSGVS